ncbi:hypothetical protein [Halobacterium noricense]|uniref:hypothetical protein n=1 Tax=Halobacterium noricense TaxID=223182 RepID=UPI001E4981EB|nr:hypothetical protein [Halobacterium noricense]UHH25590.1 hypothetical protein LT974_01285 [Halobacterium noricense]
MDEWQLVARCKNERSYLYRRPDSDIFEVRSVHEDDQLFKIENPDHDLFEPIVVDFYPQMNSKAVRAIQSNQIEAYDELDIEEGFAVVDEDKIEFECSTESEEILSASL